MQTVQTLVMENAGLSAMLEQMRSEIEQLKEPERNFVNAATNYSYAVHKGMQSEITRLQRLLKQNGVSYRKVKSKKK